MSNESIGYVQSIESFALVDGPGVRSVLFMQGCPYRCLFCHNPDTWAFLKRNPYTPEEALHKMIRYRPYWQSHGGITISGGEPLAQIDFLIAFAKLCKENGIHVAIDSSCANYVESEPFFSKFKELLQYVDLFLLDIKCIDEELHKKITGHSNQNVIQMFQYLSKIQFPIWIRYVLVPTLNDDEKLLKQTGDFIASLKNVERVEVLPYHTLGVFKYEKLGIEYPLKGIKEPTEAEIHRASHLLGTEKYIAYLQK